MPVWLIVGTGLTYVSLAVWVFLDARRRGRAVWSNVIATLMFGPLGLAVYLGMRGAAERAESPDLNSEGDRLLVEMTTEIKRLREDLSAAQQEIEHLGAHRSSTAPGQ